ncbi:helix-turn-helix transcriptional regulator [Salibacterium aidingense]|uniref:helix-turn-helix transcriptional regulator n=1 Tax=Salibacterium aidingense TaxID=384933 RepID=UPI00041DB118|nr:YafY family protein [Salibacterium aidingense]
MRADRLLSILLYLQTYGKATSKQLAEKLEVSDRTIVRDMEALSMAGVPVYAERGSQGGWRLSENYRTELTGMKTGEIQSLLLSNQNRLMSDLGLKQDFEQALQKLIAETPQAVRQRAEEVRQKIHIDAAGWHQVRETIPYLTAVQQAVWEERVLLIHYQREEKTVERRVHPLGLVAKGSIWYMAAEVEESIRTYRVSRLSSVQLLEETFVRPADFNLESYWETSIKEFRSKLPRYPAVIKMKESLQERFFKERFVSRRNNGTKQSDGWVEIEVEFQTLASATELVLASGAGIEVTAPGELRKNVAASASSIVALYEKGG